jgi:hypothetical protein
MSVWIVLTMIAIHWVSDFILQSQHMSNRKSSSNYYLTLHVTIYTFCTIVCWSLLFYFTNHVVTTRKIFLSLGLIFWMHWLTDYVTSRMTKKLYKQERYHDFFVVIGFDQLLHYIQLLLVYQYIILN